MTKFKDPFVALTGVFLTAFVLAIAADATRVKLNPERNKPVFPISY